MTNHHLVQRVRKILSERGHHGVCQPLDGLAETIEDTERNVARKVKVYKWPGLILLAAIPILSTSLSVVVTGTKSGPAWLSVPALSFVLSYTLTVLTVLNSIFRFSERFKEACRIGVDFEQIKSSFLMELESLPVLDEVHLHTLVTKFSKLVAPYQKELISMFLPEVAVETTKTPALTARPANTQGEPPKKEPAKGSPRAKAA